MYIYICTLYLNKLKPLYFPKLNTSVVDGFTIQHIDNMMLTMCYEVKEMQVVLNNEFIKKTKLYFKSNSSFLQLLIISLLYLYISLSATELKPYYKLRPESE